MHCRQCWSCGGIGHESRKSILNTRTIRQIPRETGVHRSSVHRIVENLLKLKRLKKKRAQDLTNANKLTRLDRSRQLLRKYPSYLLNKIGPLTSATSQVTKLSGKLHMIHWREAFYCGRSVKFTEWSPLCSCRHTNERCRWRTIS